MDEPKDLPPEYQEFLASQENLDDLDSPIDGDSESISSISNSKASGDFIRNPALPKRKSVLGLPTGRDYTDHHKVAERPSPYTAVSNESILDPVQTQKANLSASRRQHGPQTFPAELQL